jgi:C-terminal processing protease CtpA/Prc
MKRAIASLVVVTLALSGGAAWAQSETEQQEKRETLEQRLREERKALREAERQLRETAQELDKLGGKSGVEKQVHILWLGNRARLGVVVGRDREGDGAKVVAVTPGSPAEEAGLETGDIILSIDGKALAEKGEDPAVRLGALTRDLTDGQKVSVTFRRGGATRTVTVTARRDEEHLALPGLDRDLDVDLDVRGLEDLGEPLVLPEVGLLPPDLNAPGLPFHRWHGLEMVTLGAELGEYFGVKEGILVVSVPSDGSLPLKPGDVIVTIGGRAPASPSQAMRIIASYDPGQDVPLQVVRKRKKLSLTLKVPETDFKWHGRRQRVEITNPAGARSL